ncbi:putative serine protease F56F10.1 [Drosophila ficusphila]|uniref:putative serine protease F56F10.1 n=1 Tax=Drosophila ficusphila TaxID=30025 RepID=UPI0007E899BD|nr:putative serine protease F56F10.1 [Drosophila ficusphila]
MADVATLIRSLKENTTYFGESKVFLVGGSYSGLMVPWFAKLYPSLIDLGWASSAPVRFKTEFWEFYANVFKLILKIGGKECHSHITKGFDTLKAEIDKHDLKELIEMNICGFDHTNDSYVFNLFEILTRVIGTLVQDENIQKACDEISRTSFASYLKKELHGDSTKCYDSVSSLESLKDIHYTTDSARLWLYQCCSELGNFKTSKYVPRDFWLDMCTDVFGHTFSFCYINRKVKKTDRNFQDMESNESFRRVFLTQPELDAWSVTKVRKHNRTYILEGATHCEDLEKSTKNDKPSIKILKMDIDFEVQKLQNSHQPIIN